MIYSVTRWRPTILCATRPKAPEMKPTKKYQLNSSHNRKAPSRLVTEFLLGVNISFSVLFALFLLLQARRSSSSNSFFDWLVWAVRKTNSFFRRVPWNELGVGMVLITLTLLLAVALFWIIHSSTKKASKRVMLWRIGLVMSILATPACWIYADSRIRTSSHALTLRYYLGFELLSLCAVLYLFRTLPNHRRYLISGLLVHYGLWEWILWPFLSTVPLASLLSFSAPLSGITWALWPVDSQERRTSRTDRTFSDTAPG